MRYLTHPTGIAIAVGIALVLSFSLVSSAKKSVQTSEERLRQAEIEYSELETASQEYRYWQQRVDARQHTQAYDWPPLLEDITASAEAHGIVLTDVTLTNEQRMNLSINQVLYHDLVTWLYDLHHQYSVAILSTHINRSTNNGYVNAAITLSRDMTEVPKNGTYKSEARFQPLDRALIGLL